MQKIVQIPKGYNWRLEECHDSVGITCCLTLVASNHKPGSLFDRWFGREIITHCLEFRRDEKESRIDEKVAEAKQKIANQIFR